MKNFINLKTTTLLMFFALFSIPSFAQPGSGQGQGRGRQMTEENVIERVQRTADSLDLTDAQEKKVLEFEMEFFRKNQEVRENFDFETGDREAMREFMMKQREEREAKYAEVLTEEQLKKYQQMMDRRQEQMRQRMEEDSGEQRGRGRG